MDRKIEAGTRYLVFRVVCNLQIDELALTFEVLPQIRHAALVSRLQVCKVGDRASIDLVEVEGRLPKHGVSVSRRCCLRLIERARLSSELARGAVSRLLSWEGHRRGSEVRNAVSWVRHHASWVVVLSREPWNRVESRGVLLLLRSTWSERDWGKAGHQ